MARRPRNDHKEWTQEHHDLLREMAAEKLPVTLICKKLGRAETAVRARAREIGVPLKVSGKRRFGPSSKDDPASPRPHLAPSGGERSARRQEELVSASRVA
jgi:hypothetical protein